jgi:ribonuclease HII
MAEAVAQIAPLPDLALVDGNPVRGLPCKSRNIIKGDAKSLSIAAASVIAKVTRDRLMAELDSEFPAYGFAQHKGYGTKAHLAALRRHGPCFHHRKTFRPVAELNQGELNL